MDDADRAKWRPDLPWDANEYAWQANRPEQHRVLMPRVGDRLLFRPASWSDELIPIEVREVQDLDTDEARRDPNVYDKVTAPPEDPHAAMGNRVLLGPLGQPLVRLRDDPWPWIKFQMLDDQGEPYGSWRSCREARLRGSAGWLPLDHERRERPHWQGSTIVLPGWPA